MEANGTQVLAVGALCALLNAGEVLGQTNIGTGFTYQGVLKKDGVPVNAQAPEGCDFEFSLWDDPVDATVAHRLGDSQTILDVEVTNGFFTVAVNTAGAFGPSAFNGTARWLGIQVTCPGSPTADLGRQELTPAPHALALPGLYTQQTTSSPNLIGGIHENAVSTGVAGATISGGGAAAPENNRVSDTFGAVGGGGGNLAGNDDADPANAQFATVAGGLHNTAGGYYSAVGGGLFNTASGFYSSIDGGYGNEATVEFATIGGGETNRANGFYSSVGGGFNNTAGGVVSTVGGGDTNDATGDRSTISGGYRNTASDVYSTIGGGVSNDASGDDSTIGGGYDNTASGGDSTVGGGYNNTVSAPHSTVGGGNSNTASGYAATVPGGRNNTAGGDYSFAVGRQAKVRTAAQVGGGDTDGDQGTFVWADSTDLAFSSTGPDQFLIRAAGGVGIGTNAPATTLHVKGGDTPADQDVLTLESDSTVGTGLVLKNNFTNGRKWSIMSFTNAAPGFRGSLFFSDETTGFAQHRMMISPTGDVGIGTITPAAKLDVNGNLQATGTIKSGSSITIDGTAGSERITSTDDLEIHVAGGRALRLESNATAPSLVGGYSGNAISAGVIGATIAGGGRTDDGVAPSDNNRVTDDFGTVGGGRGNRAGDATGTASNRPYPTVGGGENNTASGTNSTVGGGYANTASGNHSTIGGGRENISGSVCSGGANAGQACVSAADCPGASCVAVWYSTVGGGISNKATGDYATVGGGETVLASGDASTASGGANNTASGNNSTVGGGGSNIASGARSTVPGGDSCVAGGDYSFAAGREARARTAAQVGGGDTDGDQGTFVWADSTNLFFTSTGPDQFLIRADGGVGIGTNNPGTHALQVTDDASAAEFVQFNSTVDLSSGDDLLALETTSTSSDTMQFIECQRGGDVEFRVQGNGDVLADGTYSGPADFAELIAVKDRPEAVEPGDVMVIDVANPRSVVKSSTARSTLVAGIHSTKPGYLGSEHDWDQVERELRPADGVAPRNSPSTTDAAGEDATVEGAALNDREPASRSTLELGRALGEIPLAIVGIVPCKVSGENGPIRPGDLLVTSSTPGHAMRDGNPKPGTIVGKALGSLDTGMGVVHVLVALQ